MNNFMGDNNYSFFTACKKEELLKKLNASDSGLTTTEVESRIKKFGLNKIDASEWHWWNILFRQFHSPFIYLLVFAVLLSFFLGEKIDAAMIGLFILINTLLGFTQEYHSEKSLRLLRKYVVARARVKRDGEHRIIDAGELVPGDIVYVETGDVIPADVRFYVTDGLIINESVLTGESIEVEKYSRELNTVAKSVPEADNMGFAGTTVVGGAGEGVVIATGKGMVMGGVAKLTVETERESLFEKGIYRFSKFILRMIIVILIFVFIANVAIKGGEVDWMELLLFSIALAVSVIPEALPVVTTLSLSRGALRLAKNHVVVKRLSAVEDLGSIEVLCTDKTGTITENRLTVSNVNAHKDSQCLFYATLASSFLAKGRTEPNNAFDLALMEKLSSREKKILSDYERVAEIPFNPDRRRNDVLLKHQEKCLLVARGAVEQILSLCADLSAADRKLFLAWSQKEGQDGKRVIAIAKKELKNDGCKIDDEERELQLLGLISFVDPIKTTTKSAVHEAKRLGVKVKIITGDAKEVAGAVAQEVGISNVASEVLLGQELETMPETEQLAAVEKYNVFARVSPEQKYLIISLLQKKYEVGFLGDGINDAPALKLSNVALAVSGAADIAREAADIILLNRSLSVIIDGIRNGRQIFANTVKYLKITLISNFGNFYAIAIASLIIPFLPMLPVQLLLLNLLSDFPMIAIAMDNVDKAELRRPRTYNIREVVLMAIFLGIVSTVFDFVFFALFYKHSPAVLQTNWFIGSVLTELVLIYSIRTHFVFWKAKRPSLVLSLLCVVAVIVAVLLPLSRWGAEIFKFQSPEFGDLLTIFTVVAVYFVLTEIIKLLYYRFTSNHELEKLRVA